ncbi:hypothetical protein [Pseudalkalibacillus caeni]|uniref:hypothetical protein n=1 Tax=Exobacillus caeni TaxID=2574798 RepID=UPI001FECC74A|nr:hypothetical protein [Pseudalkalibacillus caeni]
MKAQLAVKPAVLINAYVTKKTAVARDAMIGYINVAVAVFIHRICAFTKNP